ncbi:MAG: PEP-CTERM sorting domain-containing protein [Verrucomicrobiae bacterium]|nr:PEP-CTERM sorting domain-containing protein [Verrucomicrobiae bacterium]
MHPENPQAIRLDSALDAYCAQARTVKRPGLAQATAYTAAAGAALALAPSADAAIQYSGPQNLSVSITLPGSITTTIGTAIPLDLNGDSVTDFSVILEATSQPRLGALFRALGTNNNFLANNTTENWAERLGGGATIDPSQLWNAANPGAMRRGGWTSGGAFNLETGTWLGGSVTVGQAGFVGVRFVGFGSTNHYGWIRVGISNDVDGAPVQVTVYDWAYNDVDGEGITAGQTIPEPSPAAGLALLAAGAAGVATWRRRKQPAKA